MYQPRPQMIATNANQQNWRRRKLQLGNTQSSVLFILLMILSDNISKATIEMGEPSFLNLPMTYITGSNYKNSNDENVVSIVSHIACAGECFSSNSTVSYRYRSCQFQNMCYNTDTNEYVLFPSPEELALQEILHALPNKEFVTVSSIAYDSHTISSSTDRTKKLSLGTIRGDAQTRSSAPWFPNVVTDNDLHTKFLKDGYYQLPDDVVVFPIVLPVHAVDSARMEALLWLDFFAVHTVLSMFGLEQRKQPIFIIHNVIHEIETFLLSSPLWSIFGNETSKHIGRLTQMKVQYPDKDISATPMNSPKSSLICFKHSVAGLGMIATIRDESNVLFTHSMGRGAFIYTFRQYILSNLGVQAPPLILQRKKDDTSNGSRKPTKFQITIAGFTETEYNILEQELRMNRQIKNSFPVDVEIRRIGENLPFIDSISFTATSAIHITNRQAQHLLATATCLSRGATLIVLDNVFNAEDADDDNSVMINRVEQDYLEMAGYFNLHWLTMPSSMQMDDNVKTNVSAIVHNTFQSIINEI